MKMTVKKALASRADRFIAFCLDYLLLVIIFIPALIMAYMANNIPGDDYLKSSSEALSVFSFLAYIVWGLYLLVNRSQTPGKFIMNIQVVHHETHHRVGFWHYIIIRRLIGETLVIGIIPLINIIFQPFYFLIDSLFIFGEDCRTLHDKIAGTHVVKLSDSEKRKNIFDWQRLPKND